MSNFGVTLSSGVSDWQIFQQRDGKANLVLEGTWSWSPEWTWGSEMKDPAVMARVVDEETGMQVIPWTKLPTTVDGVFKGTLHNVPAGGLYRIETTLTYAALEDDFAWAGRGDMRHHVGVGDVYAIAGQSNAAGYAKDIGLDPLELGVHLFRANGQWTLASHPFNDGTGSIFTPNLEAGNAAHSPYLSFGRHVKKSAGYPIGLIAGALGGSPISAWNPEEDGLLYRNLLAMIKTQGSNGIRGVLWYQGCADAFPDPCLSYLERFTKLVEGLRRDLGQPDLPFFTVQLNRWISSGSTPEGDRAWGILREAQRQAAHQIPNVYIVPANDGRLSDFVHNNVASNLAVGERLARQVVRHFHGGKLPCFAPEIEEARKIAENQIELTFQNVIGTLYLFEGDARFGRAQVHPRYTPFTVEDEEGHVPLTEWKATKPNAVLITTARPLVGKAQIHGAHQANPADYLPMDPDSQLPMLSFYGVEVTS